MKHNAIVINRNDNVAVAVTDIKKGTTVAPAGMNGFKAVSDIPRGHKIALKNMKTDDDVIKYGEPIGRLKVDAKKGEWVHLHNVLIAEGE